MFELHPQLVADTVAVGEFPLSKLLLMNDSQYPWCILVPKRANVREIYELVLDDQQQLQAESSLLGKTMMALFSGDKLNIAALGNVVPQLHLHHIVRFTDDVAWPKPIWGQQPVIAYEESVLAQRIRNLQEALSETEFSIA